MVYIGKNFFIKNAINAIRKSLNVCLPYNNLIIIESSSFSCLRELLVFIDSVSAYNPSAFILFVRSDRDFIPDLGVLSVSLQDSMLVWMKAVTSIFNSQNNNVINIASTCKKIINHYPFTASEREIIDLAALGYCAGDISRCTGKGLKYVYNRLRSIRLKLGFSKINHLQAYLKRELGNDLAKN